LAWLTAALVLTNLGIVIIYVYLLAATKKSADAAASAAGTARDSLISVQRAFVNFRGFTQDRVTISTQSRSQDYWRIAAVWENLGTTPAKSAINHLAVEELPDEPSGEKFQGQREPSGRVVFVIGPKATQSSGTAQIPESFLFGQRFDPSKHRYTLFTNRKIFIWGWIGYRDVFSNTKPHVAEFCQLLTAVFYGETPEKNPTFKSVAQACQHHNCVDEDCEDYEKIAAMVPK
jgi:hypothetical protein